MALIDSGAVHNFMSAVLMQAVQAIKINVKPMYIILGNIFKVLSDKLTNLSILFASGAAQIVWCYIVPKLSTPNILGMDWFTQLSPIINWAEKIVK